MSMHTLKPSALPRWGLQLSERRALLFVGDLLAASAAALVALWLWTLTSKAAFNPAYLRAEAHWFYALVPGWILLNADLYDLRCAASRPRTLRNLLAAAAVAAGAYLGVFFISPPGLLPRLVVLYFIGGAVAFHLAWRLCYIRVFASGSFQRRALVVGAGWAGEAIIGALKESHPGQYAIVGVIDDDPGKRGTSVRGAPVLGGPECLPQLAQAERVAEIVLAINGELRGETFQALLDCQERGIDLVRMPVLYERVTGRVPIEHLDADWMLTSFVDAVRLNSLSRVFRRLVDLAAALIGLGLLIVILPAVAAAIWLESGRPVFYRQARVGRGGSCFEVLKFRTMVPWAEADGQPRWAEHHDGRVTRVGRFLRRTRMDEVPQFWNVLRGEMSLIGPRPERPEFIALLERRIPFYRARLLVKPGITGWAQINYGYGNTVEDAMTKLQYDLYYIKQRSLWLDLQILAQTVGVVLGFKGT